MSLQLIECSWPDIMGLLLYVQKGTRIASEAYVSLCYIRMFKIPLKVTLCKNKIEHGELVYDRC